MLVNCLAPFRALGRPFRSCCDQLDFKHLPCRCVFLAALAIFPSSGSAPCNSFPNGASASRRVSLLISMPRRRSLLPRNSPSSSASAAASSSSVWPLLVIRSLSSSILISTVLSNIHSSPFRRSFKSLPPNMGPRSGCSPSSSTRQSSQIGSRKFLCTKWRMEHCRLRAGNRSLLANCEPLVEVGE